MTRTQFAERLGAFIIFGHIFLVAEILALATIFGAPHVMPLLTVSVPVTVALAGPAFAWFTEQFETQAKQSRRKVRSMQVVVIGGVTILFFVFAALVPIGWWLATEQANENLYLGMFATIESAFGGMMAAVVRTLFKREDTGAAKPTR